MRIMCVVVVAAVDLLQLSWSWRPGVVVDLLASRRVDANLRILHVTGLPEGRFLTSPSLSLAPASCPRVPKASNRIGLGFLQGQRLKILASRSIDASFISQDIDGHIPSRLLPDLLQLSWSWRPGVVVDLLASRRVDANLRILHVIGLPEGRFLTSPSLSLAPASCPRVPKASNRIGLGFLQGQRLKILASRSIDASFISQDISQDIDGHIPSRLLPVVVFGWSPQLLDPFTWSGSWTFRPWLRD
ncbi:hypothetical protein Taro_016964 [Colocasia esculenta]|uniref:Uncharacterized protein n=1 Tax=Colocasia esculenta TaxID=4460 RepID=A0A843UF30_COLES|nr:hypothetical protein [Colocasia esculenta]